MQDLDAGAQGQLLEGGLPQRVGFPFLQLPAVVDDVLQVAVKRLGSDQGNKCTLAEVCLEQLEHRQHRDRQPLKEKRALRWLQLTAAL